MKKIAKIFGAIAAVGAAVAGGVALYKKFISPNEDFDDLVDELEDEMKFLKSIVRQMSEDLQKLKKAN